MKMNDKERARVQILPRYAFGDEGSEEQGVPPGATVTYTITLNSFEKVSQLLLLLLHLLLLLLLHIGQGVI